MRRLCYAVVLFLLAGLVLSHGATVAAAGTDVCRVVRVDIEPIEAARGQPVIIRATIEKTGDDGVLYPVVLLVNNTMVETREMYFARTRIDDCGGFACSAGAEVAVFTITREVPGTYPVDVNGVTGTFTVVDKVFQPESAGPTVQAAPENPDALAPAVPTSAVLERQSGGSGSLPLIGGVTGVLGMGLGVFFMIKKRRTRKS